MESNERKTLAQTVETNYPNPIATSYRRLRTLDSDDYINRHDSYCDLFEAIAKYSAIVAFEDFRARNQVPEYIAQFLKKMLHPGTGHWNEILRSIASEDTSNCPIANEIHLYYNAKIETQTKEAATALQAFLASKTKLNTNKDVFDLLVHYRNKVWKGHGAKISKEEYRERLGFLDQLFDSMLHRMDYLSKYELIYVDEIQILATGELQHKIKLSMGTLIEPSKLILQTALKPAHLYVKSQTEKSTLYVDLNPLLTFYNCRECKTDQIFIFNDYRNNHLEFLSYSCGHFIFPDMLPTDIERLLDVSLSKVTEEFATGHTLDDAETTEKATEYISMALDLVAADGYFEALEYLQLSMSFVSTWKANYYTAIVTMLTKGAPTEVLYYLNTSLQLEPDNALSQELLEKIKKYYPDDDSLKVPTEVKRDALLSIAKDILQVVVYTPDVKPIYYYFTPKILKSMSGAFWVLFPAVLLIAGGIIKVKLGVPVNNIVQNLKICLIATFVLTSYLLAKSMRSVYFSLLQQVSGKVRGQFSSWYLDQLNKTFGNFFDTGALLYRLNLQDSNNRRYLLTVVLLFPIALIGAVFLTCYDSTNLLIIIGELFDYFVIFSVMVPSVPVFIKCFNMLSEYSKLPLRPAVSAVNTYSLNRVGRMIFLVSIPWTAGYSSLTLIGYFSFSTNLIWTQLGLFYFMVFLGCIWTLVTPLYFSLALSKAKEQVLARYGTHIDTSFRNFLDNPTQENVDRYHWLSKQQTEVLKIKTGALSISTRIGIVFLNTYIISSSLAYPFIKYHFGFGDLKDWFIKILHTG